MQAKVRANQKQHAFTSLSKRICKVFFDTPSILTQGPCKRPALDSLRRTYLRLDTV